MNNDTKICPDEVTDCVSKDELPGMLEMAKNLAQDGSKIIKNALSGNRTLVDDEVRKHRWSTCGDCDRLQNDRCLECGCFMKVKVAFNTSICPLGKW